MLVIDHRSDLRSPEHHGAILPVEGEIVDGDGTSAAVDGGRQPVHAAVRRHQRVTIQRHFKLSIHTAHMFRKLLTWLPNMLHSFIFLFFFA